MNSRIEILAFAGSVALILFILHLIRRRKLREEYSILWLAGCLVLIVLSLWRELLDIVADALDIYYAPAILLLVGILFGGFMFLHFTIVISRQADINRSLAQEIALLKLKLETLTGQTDVKSD